MDTTKKSIVLVDGECSFCSASVQFIIERDPADQFSFAALQSAEGEKLMTRLNIKSELHSLILIEQNHYYKRSTAALKIAAKLNSPVKHTGLLLFIPVFIRDFFYRIVARLRSFIPGKQYCNVQLQYKDRFLDV